MALRQSLCGKGAKLAAGSRSILKRAPADAARLPETQAAMAREAEYRERYARAAEDLAVEIRQNAKVPAVRKAKQLVNRWEHRWVRAMNRAADLLLQEQRAGKSRVESPEKSRVESQESRASRPSTLRSSQKGDGT